MSPMIFMFFGVIITIYREKGEPHHAAHIRAEYQDRKAVLPFPAEGFLRVVGLGTNEILSARG